VHLLGRQFLAARIASGHFPHHWPALHLPAQVAVFFRPSLLARQLAADDEPSLSQKRLSLMNTLPSTADRRMQNHTLPFFHSVNGKLVVLSADGTQDLSEGWTGLLCSAGDVTELWYFGLEDGERSFNKLSSRYKEEAQAEISSRFGITIRI
jgi:hypothetical protein